MSSILVTRTILQTIKSCMYTVGAVIDIETGWWVRKFCLTTKKRPLLTLLMLSSRSCWMNVVLTYKEIGNFIHDELFPSCPKGKFIWFANKSIWEIVATRSCKIRSYLYTQGPLGDIHQYLHSLAPMLQMLMSEKVIKYKQMYRNTILKRVQKENEYW